MANSEATFKSEFKQALEKHYGENLAIWSHTDMMRAGLPDIGAHILSDFFPIEAKFVETLPERLTSKLLKHELTGGQATFMRSIYRTGGYPTILIGFSDVAVAIPYPLWPKQPENPMLAAQNISLGEVLNLRDKGFAFHKEKGKWKVKDFFELIRRS